MQVTFKATIGKLVIIRKYTVYEKTNRWSEWSNSTRHGLISAGYSVVRELIEKLENGGVDADLEKCADMQSNIGHND